MSIEHFPIKDGLVCEWQRQGGKIGKGFFGKTYQVCCQAKCDYVMKVIKLVTEKATDDDDDDDDDDDVNENTTSPAEFAEEVRMTVIASELGIGPKIYDAWIDDEIGDGVGYIVLEKLFPLPIPYDEEFLEYMYFLPPDIKDHIISQYKHMPPLSDKKLAKLIKETMSYYQLYATMIPIIESSAWTQFRQKIQLLNQHSICHNDIKFLNIMLNSQSELVLIDYGMAKENRNMVDCRDLKLLDFFAGVITGGFKGYDKS